MRLKSSTLSSGRVILRSEPSLNFDLNAALNTGDTLKRSAPWTLKGVLIS